MEFYLKEGDLEEFEPAPELLPIFRKLNSENKKRSESTETTDITGIYNDILKEMLHIGLKKNDFNAFTRDLSEHLSRLTDFGTLQGWGQGFYLPEMFRTDEKTSTIYVNVNQIK